MTNLPIIYNPRGLKNARRNLRKISTEAENKLWKFLRNKFLGQRFYRQFGIEHFVVDFCCWQKKLIIEVDGEVHDQPEIIERDKERQDFLESIGFKVLRFKNSEVINDLEKVLNKIKGFLV